MKKVFLFTYLLFQCCIVSAQNVAINNDGSIPDNSALLDLKSISKGVLVPRMTLAQRTAIVSPATGLLIYQNDGSTGFYYNAGTASVPNWLQLQAGLGPGWNLNGNAGTDPAIHFFGTSDNVPLHVRVNNQAAGQINPLTLNTGWGYLSLASITTGQFNSALGYFSLRSNTSGQMNSAIGHTVLSNNTIGSFNTGLGGQALALNTTGFSNTAAGYHSLLNNLTGENNTATGVNALFSNTSGTQNTAVGVGALYSNSTGPNNTALGYAALNSNATGQANVGIGSSALFSNTSVSNLVAVGDSALFNNVSATGNTAVGSKTLYMTSIGGNNTATGYQAMMKNTTGSQNTAVGYQALFENQLGQGNTAFGAIALTGNTSGLLNTAVGQGALSRTTTGNYNTGFGSGANNYNTTGSDNVAIGFQAMATNFTGSRNTIVGTAADVGGNALVNTTALGANAFVTESNSMVLGSIQGVNSATNSTNVGIGTSAPAHTLDLKTNSVFNGKVQLRLHESDNDYARMRFTNDATTNKWEIAASPNTTNSTSVFNIHFSNLGDVLSIKGDGNATLAGILTQLSDSRLKKNIIPISSALTRVIQLNGYEYTWVDQAKDKDIQYGVLAQEIQEIFPGLVKTDDNGILSVNYIGLVPVLINAVKDQQAMIERMEKRLAALEEKAK